MTRGPYPSAAADGLALGIGQLREADTRPSCQAPFCERMPHRGGQFLGGDGRLSYPGRKGRHQMELTFRKKRAVPDEERQASDRDAAIKMVVRILHEEERHAG